jgi:hypothetical protein
VNEPFGSGPVRLSRYPLGGLDMYGMKRLLSVFDVKADRVYNGVSVAVKACTVARLRVIPPEFSIDLAA